MIETPAQSNCGLAEKASVIKHYTIESDAMTDLTYSLINDCIRLAGGAA
jgi:hypothetical protein